MNRASRLGGRRTPAPTTTQSKRPPARRRSTVGTAVSSGLMTAVNGSPENDACEQFAAPPRRRAPLAQGNQGHVAQSK